MKKPPALVVLDCHNSYVRRYIRKPTGGFFTETFEIVDREAFFATDQRAALEVLRQGQFDGQETPAEMTDQPEVA